jgi:hypothetical protein
MEQTEAQTFDALVDAAVQANEPGQELMLHVTQLVVTHLPLARIVSRLAKAEIAAAQQRLGGKGVQDA